ncbi:MAG: hypothetical protein IJT73_00450 [Selenomonadaceae bacterium]|nr:hypothetical protein [Selenomonadaceae bacterium]
MTDKIGKLGYSGLIIMLACGMTILKTWFLNNDTWFLLNCGRYVLETGTFPHTEFATIHEGLDYVMDQWLTAIIFWKIYSTLGEDALIIFAWAVGFIMVYVYFRLCLFVSNGNKKISAIMALILSMMLSLHFITTRPQLFSTFILLTEIFLLEKYVHDKKIWRLCTLPLLSIIFVNMHSALWPMMTVVLLPFIAESLYQKIKPAREFEISFAPLFFTGIGIFLVGFFNPYGWGAMIYLFNSIDSNISNVVAEMLPISAGDIWCIFFLIYSSVLIVAYSKKNLPVRYFFLTFGFMVLALHVNRVIYLFFVLGTFPLAYAAKDCHPFDKFFNIRHKLFLPLFLICIPEFYLIFSNPENNFFEMHFPIKFVILASIFFLICFTFFYRREGKLFSEEIPVLRRKPLIALVVLQASIFSSVIYFNFTPRDDEQYKPAADFLLENYRAEDIVLWTGYNSGGYFEFRGIKTYLDPRAEVFIPANNHKKDIFKEYYQLKSGKLDYKEFMSRYNFTHIFVTRIDLILFLMLKNDTENYRAVFEYDFQDNDYNGKINHGYIFVPVKKND